MVASGFADSISYLLESPLVSKSIYNLEWNVQEKMQVIKSIYPYIQILGLIFSFPQYYLYLKKKI